MSRAALPFPVAIPFVEDLGLQLLGLADGRAELALPAQDRHLNSFGVVHGGVLMSLLDVAMAHAARSLAAEPDRATTGVVTIEMKTSFMRAARGPLRAVGAVMHRTPTLLFCQATVFLDRGGEDPAGKDLCCAHATGTFKSVRALPGARPSTAPKEPS